MMAAMLISVGLTAATAATPLVLAALGETVAERAGVLNLGLEGMMLLGAICAFATATETGSVLLGFAAGTLAGAAMALLFAGLVLGLAASQVASGLAVTIFATGLSSLLGVRFVGRSLAASGFAWARQDAPVLGAIAATAALSWVLASSRAGLVLRAVGENDAAAHALGHRVLRVRLIAVLFGGAMSGLAGATLSLGATPMWTDGLTAGRGWIALALVVFGAWRPWRVLGGGALFGGISVLQLYLQGAGVVAVPTQVLAMIPYLATILVLALMSSGGARRRLQAPACLGKPFTAFG